MRIGIFGGSFDPPHLGHFLAALDATEQLALDRLIWVPAAHQPLKMAPDSAVGAGHHASALDRFAMVTEMAALHPKFVASRIEIDRNGLSYTVTTVEQFAHEYPNAERFLLMGADAWSQFDLWYQPERIRTFVRVAVLARRVELESSGGVDSESVKVGDPDVVLSSRVIDMSSTEIRARVRAGLLIRGFVPDAIAAFIESKGLYRW